ncbi:MAG TPA: extracellular solute-binding protein, partial [Nitrososphaeraceae archaeon]
MHLRTKILSIILILFLVLSTVVLSPPLKPVFAQKEQVTLKVMLDNLAEPGRWNGLIQPALKILRDRHPEADIHITYTESPYNETRTKMLGALGNHTPIDLISLDQIWLGEFAEKGLLTDLTNRTEKWGRSSDWYQANWDGGSYNNKIYGIWAWTDVRGIWYWKDLLKEANVDPASLMTWNGYLTSAKILNEKLKSKGSVGMYLVAASHSPDLWYPYLWMLGGDILELRDGHPIKSSYWFPAFNSSQGVRAMEFLKEQVNAGIMPQVNALHQAQDFVNRKFAVSIDGSWVPGQFPPEQRKQLESRVGFLPLFPISSNETNQSSTLMGGWELAIPASATHKDLVWELVTIMVEPKILTPWLLKFGYLPTQSVIGEGYIGNSDSTAIPYYKKMISMIPLGQVRPSIPEYPLIAQDISEAIK